MQPPVDPVYAEVREDYEEWKLQPVVPHSRPVRRFIIELRITSDLGKEEWHGEDSHNRERLQRLPNLKLDLIL